MRNIEQTASGLFDKLRNRFSPLEIRDENRQSTMNPEQARFFSFDYTSNGKNFGPITISVLGTELKIFFSQDIDQLMNSLEKKKWYKFLKEIRFFAMPEIKDFDVRDISKSGLNLRDLKYLNKDANIFDKDDVKVNESKLYGTRRSSYQKLEDVRIIARHNKPIVDETIPGARSRNIESFYIENSQGERFKLPEGTTINGARAYARHIKNGGELHDDFSKHIGRMLKEMADLRMFVRNMRGRTFEDIETQQMVESAIDHYGKLHSDVHLIRSQRGYEQYKELWQPDVLEEDFYDITELRERFVRKVFDDRITDALPVVFREYRRRKLATEKEFESWANGIVREFDEKNPIDNENQKDVRNSQDLEEDKDDGNVNSPFANSIQTDIKDSAGNTVNADNQTLAGLFNQHGFEYRIEDGIYYFESKEEIERAKDWISYKFPTMKFPKMGIYDYGYGVYGSTTFDRELPGGKGVMESINEDLRKWFKEKWVRFGPDGKIRGDCARGDDSEGKPKCLPRAKAHALGKKGRKTAASRKRREDPNPERSGPAINVKTKESLAVIEGTESQYIAARYIDEFADGDYWYVKGTPDVIKKFVLLANSLEDEAVKGTEYEPDKGMMAKVHAQLGNDSVPQWTVVRAQNLEQLKPIGNRVLQLLMKPDLSYGAQEFMSEFLWTLEEKGLALVTTEPVQGVAEGSLHEFAPSGGEGNGPFDYGRAIVEIGQEFVDYYQDEGAQADAKAIIKVGQTFISAGMKAGIQSFYNLDTQIRDHVAEQLMEQGFNVKQDIYLPYRQQMDKEIANDTAEREKYLSSPEYAARRADDLKISAIPDKPINSWSKPGDPAASVTMDRASKRDIKAEFEKFKQDLARRDSLKGVPLRFEITVGGKPVDINSLKEQSVAEGIFDFKKQPMPEHGDELKIGDRYVIFDDGGSYYGVSWIKKDRSEAYEEFNKSEYTDLNELKKAIWDEIKYQDQRGMAEDFTDDLDNIYAMHPQPEKSEQVVFLITGMTEDEFSNRWTDLPDPYQQEFGYDLPLWDADDLSSYPNLAVKRITFDQYVQLVGNYIKSEELAGSTMSKMKQGLAEGSLEEVDRRGFLKGLGAAAVAGAAGGTKADPVYDPKTKKWDYIPNRKDAEVDMIAMYAIFKVEYPDHSETQKMRSLITQYVRQNPSKRQEVLKSFNMWMDQFTKMKINDPAQYKDRLESNVKYRNQIMSYFQDLMEFYESVKQGVAKGQQQCPECGGMLVEFSQLNEKKDACYYKVKSRYKVWPSAYASGALVKCRKKGAKNWGNKSESKLDPAAKLLESFKADLNKF